jgi:hypothetical protein
MVSSGNANTHRRNKGRLRRRVRHARMRVSCSRVVTNAGLAGETHNSQARGRSVETITFDRGPVTLDQASPDSPKTRSSLDKETRQ